MFLNYILNYVSQLHNLIKSPYEGFIQRVGERFIVGDNLSANHVDAKSQMTTTEDNVLTQASEKLDAASILQENLHIGLLTRTRILIF